MNILHLIPSFEIGGLGTLCLNIVSSWNEDRHTVIAGKWMETSKSPLRDNFSRVASTVEFNRGLREPDYIVGLKKLVSRAEELDSIILYNFYDIPVSVKAIRDGGYRKKIIAHIGTIPIGRGIDEAGKIFSSDLMKGVVVVAASQTVRDSIELLGAKNVHVICNGVDVQKYRLERQAYLKGREMMSDRPGGLVDDRVRVGTIGRLTPDAKNFEMLIRAWGNIDKSIRDKARLIIGGDGFLYPVFRDLITRLDIDDSVSLGPAIDPVDVPCFLASLDVFVLPSYPHEGMSMALVEAIATGLPIVSTDAPSNVEILQNDNDVEMGAIANDQRSMTTILEWMICSKTYREQWSNRVAVCRSWFDIKLMCDDYRSLIV